MYTLQVQLVLHALARLGLFPGQVLKTRVACGPVEGHVVLLEDVQAAEHGVDGRLTPQFKT